MTEPVGIEIIVNCMHFTHWSIYSVKFTATSAESHWRHVHNLPWNTFYCSEHVQTYWLSLISGILRNQSASKFNRQPNGIKGDVDQRIVSVFVYRSKLKKHIIQHVQDCKW